jgi:hypothetical protein
MPKPSNIYFDAQKCYSFNVDTTFQRIITEYEKEVNQPILKIEHQTAWLTDDEQILLTVLIQY